MNPIRLQISIDAPPEIVFWTAEDVSVHALWDRRVALVEATQAPGHAKCDEASETIVRAAARAALGAADA